MVEPEAPGGDEISFLDGEVDSAEVRRTELDPEDDGPDDPFCDTLSMKGPDANASVETMVVDAADVEVVVVALDTLHGVLVARADLIHRRKVEVRAIVAEG